MKAAWLSVPFAMTSFLATIVISSAVDAICLGCSLVFCLLLCVPLSLCNHLMPEVPLAFRFTLCYLSPKLSNLVEVPSVITCINCEDVVRRETDTNACQKTSTMSGAVFLGHSWAQTDITTTFEEQHKDIKRPKAVCPGIWLRCSTQYKAHGNVLMFPNSSTRVTDWLSGSWNLNLVEHTRVRNTLASSKSKGLAPNSVGDIDGLTKKDVTPLLTHWSYVFLAITQRYETHHNLAIVERTGV